ncbi:MAG: class I SAM-dependent methyltransferase family protein [Fervidicoccaceae archaeon]|nr:class I SAM-dependent methyltransferase family protein [Fervidicoccaceae archaeon]
MRERVLKELLPKYGLEAAVSTSFDLIGDILILRRRPGYELDLNQLRRLGEELLTRFRYVRTIFIDVAGVKGEHRTRELVFVVGEPKTRTVYKEHGLSFHVDVVEAYISPRLSYEHVRVARLVREGEVVVNMFAGVGSFSIFIAKLSKPSVVYSIDINPVAYELMVENIRLNNVESIVKPILGDAAEVTRNQLAGLSDRVLMPLPNMSERFYCSALASLKKEGFIHAYEFLHVDKNKSKQEALNNGFSQIKSILQSCGEDIHIEIALQRVVRTVGPRWIQGVFDIFIKKN